MKRYISDLCTLFSPEEAKILPYIIVGYPPRKIGKVLNFETKFVSNRVFRIMFKLNLKGRKDIIVFYAGLFDFTKNVIGYKKSVSGLPVGQYQNTFRGSSDISLQI